MWMARRLCNERPFDKSTCEMAAMASFSELQRVPLFELHGSLSRIAAVDSLIAIEVELMNPLKIPLECNNLGAYGKLIESTTTPSGTHKLSNTELFQIANDPFIGDQDSNVVEFLLQHVRFDPRERKLLRLYVIPKRPGQLHIFGIRWDLYGSVRVSRSRNVDDELVES